jgi:hypothetical protein
VKKVLFCLLCVVCFLTSCGKPNSAAKKTITTNNDNLAPSPASSTKPNASESSKIDEPKEKSVEEALEDDDIFCEFISIDDDTNDENTGALLSSDSDIEEIIIELDADDVTLDIKLLCHP